MVTWVVYLGIGLIAGIGIGIYLSQLGMLRSKKQLELEAELNQARDTMQLYQQDVARHFVHTSSLINNMTESYRAVFEHLSDGAKQLCGNEFSPHLLDLPQTRKLILTEASQEQAVAPAPSEHPEDTAGAPTQDATPASASTPATATTPAPAPAAPTTSAAKADAGTGTTTAKTTKTSTRASVTPKRQAADIAEQRPARSATLTEPAPMDFADAAHIDANTIKTVSESQQPNDEHADFIGEQDAPPAPGNGPNRIVH